VTLITGLEEVEPQDSHFVTDRKYRPSFRFAQDLSFGARIKYSGWRRGLRGIQVRESQSVEAITCPRQKDTAMFKRNMSLYSEESQPLFWRILTFSASE